MKKLKLSLIALSLFGFIACNSSSEEGEGDNEGSDEEVEFEDGEKLNKQEIIDACKDEAIALYGEILDADAYCSCAIDIFSGEFGAEELASLGTQLNSGNSTAAFEEMLNGLSPEATTEIVGCLQNSLSDNDAKLSDLSPEMYQMTIDGCVAEINRSGGLGEVSGEEYCTCFFDKIKDDFTYAQLLEANENPEILPMDAVYECLGMDAP